MAIRSFRDLEVWRVSMQLVEEVYRLTLRFPVDERYGLVAQLRRAAVSIPSNIAEGSVLQSRSYLHHLRIALGSEAELQTQLALAIRLELTSHEHAEPALNLAGQVGRMLRGLIKSLIPDP
ncbi:MAG: four helix bundle protein [Vicinamibacterales bacterium]